ncbi:MAG: hypothetical protein QXS27_01020 [Candidatus Jordarchaeaceae archaeon]
MDKEKLITITRIIAGIILAAFLVLTIVKVFWMTPFTFYPFSLAFLASQYTNIPVPDISAAIPVWQIALHEGNYLWSNRVIDAMALAIAFLATGIGAAILLRAEPEEKQQEEKGAEE